MTSNGTWYFMKVVKDGTNIRMYEWYNGTTFGSPETISNVYWYSKLNYTHSALSYNKKGRCGVGGYSSSGYYTKLYTKYFEVQSYGSHGTYLSPIIDILFPPLQYIEWTSEELNGTRISTYPTGDKTISVRGSNTPPTIPKKGEILDSSYISHDYWEDWGGTVPDSWVELSNNQIAYSSFPQVNNWRYLQYKVTLIGAY